MPREILFVYGSLKRGERHHDELERGGAIFLGEAWTEPGYTLVPGPGDYLALVRVGVGVSASRVPGELFDVDAALLRALDIFEGEDYRRVLVRVTGAPATPGTVPARAPTEALAYVGKAR